MAEIAYQYGRRKDGSPPVDDSTTFIAMHAYGLDSSEARLPMVYGRFLDSFDAISNM